MKNLYICAKYTCLTMCHVALNSDYMKMDAYIIKDDNDLIHSFLQAAQGACHFLCLYCVAHAGVN